jgi:hypothetical protein
MSSHSETLKTLMSEIFRQRLSMVKDGHKYEKATNEINALQKAITVLEARSLFNRIFTSKRNENR